VVNAPHRGRGVEADTFSKGIALGGISGSVMAASLYVIAYLPDGQRVFEGVGGFDFIQEVDLGGALRRPGSVPSRAQGIPWTTATFEIVAPQRNFAAA